MSATRQYDMASIMQQIAVAESGAYNNQVQPNSPQTPIEEATQPIDPEMLENTTGVVNIDGTTYIVRTKEFFKRFGNILKTNGYRTNRWLGSIPTPGDVWVPLFLLLFAFLVILPVNGKSRIHWLFNTVFGFSGLPQSETQNDLGGLKQPVNDVSNNGVVQNSDNQIININDFYRSNYMILSFE